MCSENVSCDNDNPVACSWLLYSKFRPLGKRASKSRPCEQFLCTFIQNKTKSWEIPISGHNPQVTQWRGCYDDICEYRTEVTSNSPEFTKKKRGKCSHVIKDLHTSTTPLRCSTMPFECPKTKQEYTKNTLRTGEDIWRIYQ